MKNFTLAAAGMALVMTASAAGLNMGAKLAFQPSSQAKADLTGMIDFAKCNIKPVEDIHTLLAKKSKGKKAPSAEDITGEYIFGLGDWYFQGGYGEFEIGGTISFQEEFCVLETEAFMGLPFVGEYDAKTGEIMFFAINLGEYEFELQSGGTASYYLTAEPFHFNGSNSLDYYEYSVKYDEAIQGFEFPEECGVMWNIYEDQSLSKCLGYFYGMDILDILRPGESIDMENGWVDFDTAEYYDGWMIPGFGEDPQEYPWTVWVQRNENNPNLYRIEDPYGIDGCPLAQYSEPGGYILFDISDPDRVVVTPKVWNGMMEGPLGLQNTDLYSYYHTYPNKAIQDFGSEEEFNSFCDQYKVYSTYDQAQGTVYFNYCRIQLGNRGCYVWDESMVDFMFGGLCFDEIYPEVDYTKVAAEVAEQGAAEFFNLQGVRVANPEAGQLVIKRQGGKASKVVVK